MKSTPDSRSHSGASSVEPMPEGVHNVYIFDIFNTTSWSVVLGTPMLLFYQHLNATATILAIAAGLSPVLNILQIPAARFVERVGYRRFVLSGWTTRSIFVIGMAVIAFLPDTVDRTTRIVSMLFLAFIYNVSRGISVCGMLPWFTHIIPESRRGEFLARDQLASAMASIGCLFISGALFKLHSWYSYGFVFSISAVAAFVSLYFLRRIPDVPVEKIVRNESPLPWREMFFYPPFLKYIRYNVIINMALGASGAFWVRYFRVFLHVSESNILFIACLSTIVIAVGLFLVGPLIDHAGNKPALTLSGLFYTCHFSGWMLVAAGILPYNLIVLTIQIFTSGIAGALWNLANVRAVMGIVPAMGRPHFLALYSVASNLTIGLIPLAWGPIMDSLERWQVTWGWWHWNCYTLFYFVLVCTIINGLFALRSVAEPRTMTWDVFMRELLVRTPSRAVSRLIGRVRGTGLEGLE
ncbi:MAG: MFS transporter [Methylacidiphilales bacterium]|nr:MFS transporter [Candidatus Methylacidiphilales bacterium]